MILLSIFLTVPLLFVVLAYFISTNGYKWANSVVTGMVSYIVVGLVLAVMYGQSYSSYLGARTFYDGTREQYASAVQMYHDYAVLDLRGVEALAFTDLKYEGYQQNMAKYINNLRDEIIGYNKIIVSKRAMKRNAFFSWCIIAPDPDMKVIKMTAKAEPEKSAVDRMMEEYENRQKALMKQLKQKRGA